MVGNVADLVSVQTGRDPSYATGKTSRRPEAEDEINVIPVDKPKSGTRSLGTIPVVGQHRRGGPQRSGSFPGTWRTPYCAAHIDDAAIYPQGLLVAVERSPDMKPSLGPSGGQER